MHPLWLLEHQISTQSLEGLSFPNCASRGRLLIIWKDSQEIYRDGKGVLAEGRAIFLKGDPCSRDSTQSLHRWTEHHGIPSCEITHFEHRAFLYLQVLGSFHQGIFLGGGWVESELFYLPLCVPKALGGELGRHMWSSLLPNPRLGVSASSGSCQSLESR